MLALAGLNSIGSGRCDAVTTIAAGLEFKSVATAWSTVSPSHDSRHGGIPAPWPPHAQPLTPAAGTDDGSRTSIWLISAKAGTYSCGHSAGFKPASLGPEPGSAARARRRTLSSAAPSVSGP